MVEHGRARAGGRRARGRPQAQGTAETTARPGQLVNLEATFGPAPAPAHAHAPAPAPAPTALCPAEPAVLPVRTRG